MVERMSLELLSQLSEIEQRIKYLEEVLAKNAINIDEEKMIRLLIREQVKKS